MQTKEEVLISFYDEIGDCFMLGDGIDFFDGKLSSVYKAMDTHAKNIAIEFAKWKDKNYRYLPATTFENYYLISDGNKPLRETPTYTLEELYALFLNKDNPNDIPENLFNGYGK